VDIGYDNRLREDRSAYCVNPLKAIKLIEETFSNPMKKVLLTYAREKS